MSRERAIKISHETVRYWSKCFGPTFGAGMRKNQDSGMRAYSNRQCYSDEVFVEIVDERHYLWRAAGHKGEVLASCLSKRGDRKAVSKFVKSLVMCHSQPQIIVNAKLRPYSAAMNVIGNVPKQENGPLANQPRCNFTCAGSTTRDKRAPSFLPGVKSLQSGRHLDTRDNFKRNQSAALSKWRHLCSA